MHYKNIILTHPYKDEIKDINAIICVKHFKECPWHLNTDYNMKKKLYINISITFNSISICNIFHSQNILCFSDLLAYIISLTKISEKHRIDNNLHPYIRGYKYKKTYPNNTMFLLNKSMKRTRIYGLKQKIEIWDQEMIEIIRISRVECTTSQTYPPPQQTPSNHLVFWRYKHENPQLRRHSDSYMKQMDVNVSDGRANKIASHAPPPPMQPHIQTIYSQHWMP